MSDIVIRDLSKAYGNQPVLRNFSVKLKAGEVSCLMAPSGSGKTTLLHILLGLQRPDSGTVSGLEGKRISAVFQEDRLLEQMDAVSNLRLVNPGLARGKAAEALAAVGITEAAGKPVRDFSGGMKRRVALLRALMCEWDVLIMDEPFRGLDEELRRQTAEWLLKRIDGRTVVMVTHDPEEAALMNARIIDCHGFEGGTD